MRLPKPTIQRVEELVDRLEVRSQALDETVLAAAQEADGDSTDFAEGERYALWGCIVHDAEGKTVASLLAGRA